MGRRDDFSPDTKELLAKRVGYRCSNHECRLPTSGPQKDPEKVVNVGVAAHITAASPDGPRYDPSLTSEQRKSANNGIWLCQKCGKLVDNDPNRYQVEKLRGWKKSGEETSIREIESGGARSVEAATEDAARDDFCNQLDALRQTFLADIWRFKPGGLGEGYTKLKPTIKGTLERLNGLKWNHPAFLRLPDRERQEFEIIIKELDELQKRADDGVWYSSFTVHSNLGKLVKSLRTTQD